MSKKLGYKAVPGILNRETALAESADLSANWGIYLEELCNLATCVLARCEKSMKGVRGTPSSLVHLYRHIIQMADAVHVLCLSGCFPASVPILRSLWEGVVSMHYMLDDDFDDRSTAWLACSYLESRDHWEALDLSTSKGQEFATLLSNDAHLRHAEIQNSNQEAVRAMLSQYEQLLKKKKFASVLAKIPESASRKRKWYAVNGGPRDLSSLAKRLERPAQYRYLYGMFSFVTHAKDASRTLAVQGGVPCFAGIRSVSGGEFTYLLASAYLIEATQMIAEKLRPEEKIRDQIREVVKRHRPNALQR